MMVAQIVQVSLSYFFTPGILNVFTNMCRKSFTTKKSHSQDFFPFQYQESKLNAPIWINLDNSRPISSLTFLILMKQQNEK